MAVRPAGRFARQAGRADRASLLGPAFLRTLLQLALAGAACGEAPKETPKTGQASLRFSVSNTVRRDRNLTDPLVGTIHGAIFRAAQVTVTGPIEGAESLEGVLATNVDLTKEDQISEVLHTTIALVPETYTFLGFFDVDGNGDESESPDAGDPVTLPINKFEVKAGATVPVVIPFDLVFNG